MKQTHDFLSIRIFGLITGFLLFTAFFAMLLNGVFFNSGFYKYAFEEFGIYDSLSELAGNPARELSTKVSITPAIDTAMIADNITSNMVHVNTDTIVEGLIRYFSGQTNLLPDLSLSGLTALENINLQVFMMYAGESGISNIFIIISLIQYTLVYIPVTLLLLLSTTMIYMLNKSAAGIKQWVFCSAFSYCIICIAAAAAIQLAPVFLYNYVISGAGLLLPSLSSIIAKLSAFFANVLSIYLLLSGTLLYAGVRLSEMLLRKSGSMENVLWYTAEIALSSKKCKKAVVAVLVISLSGAVYTSTSFAYREFESRDLGQKLSLLWENNPLYHYIDAKNEQVYLLEIHAVDSNSNPVPYLGLQILNSGNDPAASQNYSCKTDQEGNATILLDRGSYTLYMMDPFNMPVSPFYFQFQSWPFQLSAPGKSVLNLTLDRKDDGLLYFADTSLQYMP